MERVHGIESPCNENQSMGIVVTQKGWCRLGRAPWHRLEWHYGQEGSLEKEKRKVCNSEGVQVHESGSCRAELWLEYFKYGRGTARNLPPHHGLYLGRVNRNLVLVDEMPKELHLAQPELALGELHIQVTPPQGIQNLL